MDNYKIEYFKADFPHLELPIIGHLNSDESEKLFNRLKEKLGIVHEADPVLVYKEMLERSTFLFKIDDPSRFILSEVLSNYHIQSTSVYIDWKKFDDIDIFSLETVDMYFDYLWYEGADDIVLFDEGLMWVIIIDHEGGMCLLKF